MIPTCVTVYSRNLVKIKAKVHSTYYLPDRTRTMIVVDQPFDIDGAQNKL